MYRIYQIHKLKVDSFVINYIEVQHHRVKTVFYIDRDTFSLSNQTWGTETKRINELTQKTDTN